MSTPHDPQHPGKPADQANGDPAGRTSPDAGAPGEQPNPGEYGRQQYTGQPGPGLPPGTPSGPATGAPAVRPRNNLPKIFGIAVAVVVLVAVAIFVRQSQTRDSVNADVGDCIMVAAASATDARTGQVDCGAPAASYVVTETGGSPSCDPDESSFTQGDTTLCLRPNLNAGDCITPSTTNDDRFQKIDCDTATAADSKVTLVDTSVADAGSCAEGSEAVLLTERKVTYCLSPTSG